LRQALKLDPGNADILAGNGIVAMDLGRFDEAVHFIRRALQRDPLHARFHEFLGRTYMAMGRFDEAEDSFRRQAELSPDYPGTWYRIARVMVLTERTGDALEILRRETSESYESTGLAMAHYAAGNSGAADDALAVLVNEYAVGSGFQIAEIYAARRDIDNAFLWLENSYDNHDTGLVTMLATPEFRVLHDDPRWIDLLQRIGLLYRWRAMPPEWGGPSPAADD
jgi:serine/threonine-protein kinase